jgi:MOSC domain-containing protein YiiM
MVHLGGIRADILTDGELRVGDTLRLLPDVA